MWWQSWCAVQWSADVCWEELQCSLSLAITLSQNLKLAICALLTDQNCQILKAVSLSSPLDCVDFSHSVYACLKEFRLQNWVKLTKSAPKNTTCLLCEVKCEQSCWAAIAHQFCWAENNQSSQKKHLTAIQLKVFLVYRMTDKRYFAITRKKSIEIHFYMRSWQPKPMHLLQIYLAVCSITTIIRFLHTQTICRLKSIIDNRENITYYFMEHSINVAVARTLVENLI